MYNYRNGKGWQPTKTATRAWDTATERLGLLGMFLALIVLGMSSSLRAAPLDTLALPGSPLIDTIDTRITYTYDDITGGTLVVQGYLSRDHDANAGTPNILAVEQYLNPPLSWGTATETIVDAFGNTVIEPIPLPIRNAGLNNAGDDATARKANWTALNTAGTLLQTEYYLQAKFDTAGVFVPGNDSFYNVKGIVDGFVGSVFGPAQDQIVFDPHFDPTLVGSNCFAVCSQGDLISGKLLSFGFTGDPSGGSLDKVLLEFNISVTGGDFYRSGWRSNTIRPDHGIIIDGDVMWGTNDATTTPSAATSYNTINAVNGWDTDLDNLSGALLGNFVSCDSGCDVHVKTFVPVPAAVWLFGSGLFGLLGIGVRNRRRSMQ